MRPKRHHHVYIWLLAIILPAVASAQGTQIPRIGFLAWSPCERVLDRNSAFIGGFRELGYEPGETIEIECRSAGEDYEKITLAAAELVELRVDVIVALSHPVASIAREITETIPIVAILSGDPVRAGLARSLARPGGNVTGVTYYATELTGKRLDLLIEAIPDLATVHVLANPALSYLPFEEDTKRAAGKLGISSRIHHVRTPADLSKAFSSMKAENAQAVFILPDLMLATEASHIASLALEHRLPTMSWGRWFTQAGCLMAYSAQYGDLIRRLPRYVDRILKGEKPSDLPIEQPMNFDLSINLTTARHLGLDLPQTLLLRADNFFE